MTWVGTLISILSKPRDFVSDLEAEVIKLNFCSDFEHFGQDFLKLKFWRDFEAEVWSAFCR